MVARVLRTPEEGRTLPPAPPSPLDRYDEWCPDGVDCSSWATKVRLFLVFPLLLFLPGLWCRVTRQRMH